MSTAQFSFSWNRLVKAMMTPLLAGPRHSAIQVTSDSVVVSMGARGWAFSADVPKASIVTAIRVKGPVWGWGAHGWRDKWLVNGSSKGLVHLTIAPKAPGRCLGFRLRVGELVLSLADPDAFVRAVTPRPG